MAYGIKYQFRLESTHGVEYTVNISKDGYSGDVISRPLGKAPILRKSVNGCIHSTTLDLVLECHVDGEYSEFYNAAPGEYFVSLFRNGSEIWQGPLVTELYSAPEIAPPYDVNVTANDGLALAKEFLYQPQGPITPLNLIKNLLSDIPGINRGIYIVSGIGATDTTTAGFWDTALINLDYMAGETKYDVLTYFLETIHATITQHDTDWLIARETDVAISSGAIPCLRAARTGGVFSSSITGASKSAGQMGVADLWPIGHMSTNVSPAKRRVTIEAPYHVASGVPAMGAGGWSIYDDSHAMFQGDSCILTYATLDHDPGEVYTQIPIRSFTKELTLSFKAATYLGYVYPNDVDLKVYVAFTPTGGTTMYYNGIAWTSSGEALDNPTLPRPVGTIENPEDYSYGIEPIAEFADGTLDITFVGCRARVSDVYLGTVIGKGHKDTIIINNGARGDGDTTEIAGARVVSADVVSPSFLQGIFLHPDASPVEGFFDNNFSGPLSFMSLTAMGYALSVALPRLELTGLFNVPTTLSTVPLVVTYGGVNYWVESFDLNVLEEELTLTARSLPSATLSVESETITELPDDDARGGSSSGGGGGGGGGGGTGTVTSVGMTVPAGMTISGSPVTGSGTLALGLGEGKAIPDASDVSKGVTAYGWGNHALAGYADAEDVNDALALKQDEIGDLSTIRNNASKGATAYGWGDHAQAGYADADDVEDALALKQDEISDLSTIRSNASHGETAYGWGDHAQAGYANSSDLAGYLPKTGGELTGDLWLHTNSSNYGSKLWFGDKGSGAGFVYLHEDSDDHLEIYAANGIELATGSNSDVTVNGVALTPDDYVTKSGQQTITGEKTFTTNPVHIGSTSGIDVDGSSYIDIGDARLKWDASTHSLHVTKRPGSSYSGDINVYADGDVGAGGPGSGSSVKYVNCANQSAYDSISPKDPATIYTIGTASSPSKIYLGSVQIY